MLNQTNFDDSRVSATQLRAPNKGESVIWEKFSTLLRRIVADEDRHARWLNTLSFLEYIGCRKILKSRDQHNLNSAVLEHMAEEARHARLLKTLSLKLAGGRYTTYHRAHCLAGEAAEAYFQDLDREISLRLAAAQVAAENGLPDRELSEADELELNYLYMTWLIELRALAVYPLHRQVAAESGFNLAIGSLLTEEDRHLGMVADALQARDPRWSVRAPVLERVEQELFARFVGRLEKELQDEFVAG